MILKSYSRKKKWSSYELSSKIYKLIIFNRNEIVFHHLKTLQRFAEPIYMYALYPVCVTHK